MSTTKMPTHVNFRENYIYIKMTSDINYKMVIEQLEQNSGTNGYIISSAPKKRETLVFKDLLTLVDDSARPAAAARLVRFTTRNRSTS